MSATVTVPDRCEDAPSIFRLLDPAVLADPYPLYRTLRDFDPVHWDPYLHCWVVTSYAECVTVLREFSADRKPSLAQLDAIGLSALTPVAAMMMRQMLFMDAPSHTRLRGLCSAAFTPRRVDALGEQVQAIADALIDRVLPTGRMEVLSEFAEALPAIVTATMLGVPAADHAQLKLWSADFAEILGAFGHSQERARQMLASVEAMAAYFRSALRDPGGAGRRTGGLLYALAEAEVDGARLSEDEVIANTIVTMVGGQETTTNLIASGLLTLLRQPERLAELRDDPAALESGIEELLRFESPSQHTGRLARADTTLGGKRIRAGDLVMAVMGAANRDPARFRDPDRLDLRRGDNRHLAFGWAAHFCFGAPLARLEAQVAFATLLRRLRNLALPPQRLVWRDNSGLRGLRGLNVTFDV